MGVNNYVTLIKGSLKDLGHTSKACKVHPNAITIPAVIHPFPLGIILFILNGPHLLIGLMHLSILPKFPIKYFSHMLLHILSGITHHKVGGVNSTNLLLYFLHFHLKKNLFILLHLGNLRCLLNQI